MRRRFTLETTLYGKRAVTRNQLYELQREVCRAASLARQDDPAYVTNRRTGMAASQSKVAPRR